MGLEREIKLKVEGFEAVRRKLEMAGAEYVGTETETNTFLDRADGGLLKAGSGLRVRKAVDEATGRERCTVTHKGPRKAGIMKVREETEIGVDSYEGALALLERLGFGVTLSFAKRRETWRMGKCEVVLDELELGRYVEIEGADEGRVLEVRKKLGLEGAEVEVEAYATLVARARMSGRGKDDAGGGA